MVIPIGIVAFHIGIPTPQNTDSRHNLKTADENYGITPRIDTDKYQISLLPHA